MRPIDKNEICLSAAEIADKFEAISGAKLHPTNVGNAAKKLGIDYIEIDEVEEKEKKWYKPQKKYSELDVPDIFKELWTLKNNRDKFS